MCRWPERKIIRVVRRGDLDCAGAEVAADPLVENDRNLAIRQRQAQLLAMQVQVALVLRMDRHGHVAEHRLGPRGRNGQELAGILAIRRQAPGSESPTGGPCARRRPLRDR